MSKFIVLIDTMSGTALESGVFQPWSTAPVFDTMEDAMRHVDANRNGRRAEIHETESGEMKDARVVARFS